MSKSVDRENGDNGHPDFLVQGIGPIRTLKGRRERLDMEVGKYVEVQLVQIPKDGQQGAKLKLIKLSNDMLHQAYKMGLPIAGLAGVLGSVVKERGMYFDSIGEFFQLFGRFEQMLGLADGYNQGQIDHAMKAKLGNDFVQHSRKYVRAENESLMPLPLYVRNVAGAPGNKSGKCSTRWRHDNRDSFAKGLAGSHLREALEARPEITMRHSQPPLSAVIFSSKLIRAKCEKSRYWRSPIFSTTYIANLTDYGGHPFLVPRRLRIWRVMRPSTPRTHWAAGC